MEIQGTVKCKRKKTGKRARRGRLFFKRVVFLLLFIILLPFLLIFSIINKLIKKSKRKKWEKNGVRGKLLLMQTDISNIDKMEDYEFENYLRTLFFYDGYEATRTTWARDYGADVILNKNSEKIVVHAFWSKKTVGVKKLKEVIASKKHYHATQAFVVTNIYFTTEAKAWSNDNSIQVIERDDLINIIDRVKERLKRTTTGSELVDKFDKNIIDKFPHMI